ncbi:MAG TPA: hypothetical protein VGG02_03480 [Chthoniobacterales bacterium]
MNAPASLILVRQTRMRTTHYTRNLTDNFVLARVQRRGVRHQRIFTRKAHGSWKAAESAAAKWVRQMERELPAPATSRDQLTARNRSGVVGVHRRCETVRKASGRRHEYFAWVARWPGCRLRAGVKWPIQAYGEDDAFVLAVLSRRLETDDRETVLSEFMKIADRKPYREILALRSGT